MQRMGMVLALILLVLVSTSFAGSLQGTGPLTVTSVAEAKATEANTGVVLTGHMVKAVSDNRFVFSDGTGELFVSVDGDQVDTAALANHEIDVKGMIVGDFMFTEVKADSVVVHN